MLALAQALTLYPSHREYRTIGSSGGRVLALHGMSDRLTLLLLFAERGACTTRNFPLSFCRRPAVEERRGYSASSTLVVYRVQAFLICSPRLFLITSTNSAAPSSVAPVQTSWIRTS